MKRVAFALAAFLAAVTTASAQLPSGPNIFNEWYQDETRGVRVLYGFSSPKPDNIHCRIDFHFDGRISLLVVQGFHWDNTTDIGEIVTWYTLVPTSHPDARGVKLRISSSKTLKGSLIESKPHISAEDPFTRFCVPRLPDLFWQIPEEEAALFTSQFGELFELD